MLTSTSEPCVQIRVIAEWFQKLDPQSDGAARDWVAIYDECSRILYQEIDYRLEGANADRFRCDLVLLNVMRCAFKYNKMSRGRPPDLTALRQMPSTCMLMACKPS